MALELKASFSFSWWLVQYSWNFPCFHQNKLAPLGGPRPSILQLSGDTHGSFGGLCSSIHTIYIHYLLQAGSLSGPSSTLNLLVGMKFIHLMIPQFQHPCLLLATCIIAALSIPKTKEPFTPQHFQEAIQQYIQSQPAEVVRTWVKESPICYDSDEVQARLFKIMSESCMCTIPSNATWWSIHSWFPQFWFFGIVGSLNFDMVNLK